MLLRSTILLLLSSVVLAPYTRGRELGRGSFGIVYKGEYTALKRKVVIKCPINQDAVAIDELNLEAAIQLAVFEWLVDPIALNALETERFDRYVVPKKLGLITVRAAMAAPAARARARAKVRYDVAPMVPVVRAIEVFDLNGETCVAMDKYKRGNMDDEIARYQRKHLFIGLPELQHILRPLAVALSVMHAHGLAHRDIKPENVMMATATSGKWADFGLSCYVQAVAPGAQPQCGDDVAGTDGYKARELYGVDPFLADPRPADIFAFGVMLWEFACGAYILANDDVYTPPEPACPRMSPQTRLLYNAMVQNIAANRITAADILTHAFWNE